MENINEFKKNNTEKESPKPLFQKVVGSTLEYRDGISRALTNQFKEQSISGASVKELLAHEIQKTNEQYQIIFSVNAVTDELLQKYGREKLEVPPQNVHLFEKKLLVTESQQRITDAGFAPQGQMIILSERVHENNIVFASTLIHEMMHAKAHNALKIEEDANGVPESIGVYRGGLQIGTKDGKTCLINIDEGLTEIIAINLLPKLLETPTLKEEAQQQEIIKEAFKKTYNPSFDMEEILYIKTDSTGHILDDEEHGYLEQRNIVHLLTQKLYERNTARFKDKKDVEDFLIGAKVTGHLVELANLVDTTFGKGSFRKIAESDYHIHDSESVRKLIESL